MATPYSLEHSGRFVYCFVQLPILFGVIRFIDVNHSFGNVTRESRKNRSHSKTSHSTKDFVLQIDGERMPV